MGDAWKDRSVLVTGGLGFIGSHLVERLLGLGARVTVVDNASTGRLANLKHVESSPGLRIVQMDVADVDRLPPVFEGIEVVFHLAALADIVPSIQQPMLYYRANVTGTAGVMEACKKVGVKRVVYAASSSCYGIPSVYPT